MQHAACSEQHPEPLNMQPAGTTKLAAGSGAQLHLCHLWQAAGRRQARAPSLPEHPPGMHPCMHPCLRPIPPDCYPNLPQKVGTITKSILQFL